MFNDNLISLIQQKLPECLKPDCSFEPQYYPHILDKQLEKVLKNFLELKYKDETVLMMLDTSLFGRGKNGLVFTDRAVYLKLTFGTTYYCKYSDWKVDKDETEKILKLSRDDAFFYSAFLDNLMNDICNLKKYEGLFEEEEKAEEKAKKAAARKKAAKKSDGTKTASKKSTSKKTEGKKASGKKAEDKESAEGENKNKKKQKSLIKDDTIFQVADFVIDVLSDPSK
ncbi:MAG: hypothetical protein IJ619_09465 [Eubacterium sp.]|nr:hypothetical protein [Eubacterium sp.]